MSQIDENLQYWPEMMVHRLKQRLTKITQYLIRMRKLKNKLGPEIIGIKQKEERRDKSRRKDAEGAAKLDNAIKQELLSRLEKRNLW